MVTTSDFIKKIILNKGYNNMNEFARKHKLGRNFTYCINRNCWTKKALKKVSDILGVDLSMFENACIHETRDYFDDED